MGNSGNSVRLYFLRGSKIAADGDCSYVGNEAIYLWGLIRIPKDLLLVIAQMWANRSSLPALAARVPWSQMTGIIFNLEKTEQKSRKVQAFSYKINKFWGCNIWWKYFKKDAYTQRDTHTHTHTHTHIYIYIYSEKWKSLSCVQLLWPMDYTVYGIHQARILEWVAFPFSRGSSQPRDRTKVSHIAGKLFTSWATMESQEYWSG